MVWRLIKCTLCQLHKLYNLWDAVVGLLLLNHGYSLRSHKNASFEERPYYCLLPARTTG